MSMEFKHSLESIHFYSISKCISALQTVISRGLAAVCTFVLGGARRFRGAAAPGQARQSQFRRPLRCGCSVAGESHSPWLERWKVIPSVTYLHKFDSRLQFWGSAPRILPRWVGTWNGLGLQHKLSLPWAPSSYFAMPPLLFFPLPTGRTVPEAALLFSQHLLWPLDKPASGIAGLLLICPGLTWAVHFTTEVLARSWWAWLFVPPSSSTRLPCADILPSLLPTNILTRLLPTGRTS